MEATSNFCAESGTDTALVDPAGLITCRVVRTLDEIPWGDWQQLVADDDAMMDRRFIAATIRSTTSDTLYWFATFYNASGEPVGAACLCQFTLDALLFSSHWVRRVAGQFRRLVPRYLMFRVLMCGLPVSAGGSHLRIAPGADGEAIVAALSLEISRIARQQRAWLAVAKEFDRRECQYAEHLVHCGYLRTDSLPMNTFEHRFPDFDAFLAAIRSHYRYKMTRSRKKFRKAGLTVEHLTDPAAMQQLYTPEVHRLYNDVVARAEHKLEELPREFFLELAGQFDREVSLTVVRKDNRVVGFAWGLMIGSVYRNLFVGVDYSLNDSTDLYFNLMIQDLDYAMRLNPSEILVGQSAAVFKSRLGCQTDPRYVYIKCTSRWLHWCMKVTAAWLFPPIPAPPARDLFKATDATGEENDAERS